MTEQQILLAIMQQNPASRAEFNRVRTSVCGELKTEQPPNNRLLRAYQTLLQKKSMQRNEAVERFLRKANVRSQSGIAVITSLVKPYACPGKCVYCPTEVRMPKSYIATEPAAARALRLNFSPFEQMRQRILMLEQNGHPTDKIEYIVKGGTWNAYPLRYQYWFILESFRAANERLRNKEHEIPPQRDPARGGTRNKYNETMQIEDLQQALKKEQGKNEMAKHRIIGITLETRPDAISSKTIWHMRQMGCTRIELGLQAPDDRILALVKRGHTVQQFRDAMCLLRSAGFKVDLHFMPDLPGTTPEHDVDMYKMLFSDPGLKPDMVKIYPNTVIPSAELYQWFLDGRYKPYGDEALFDALLRMKLATPRYCRISRLIRDIPATEIAAGNTVTNLREMLAARLAAEGKRCVCLRCREIGRHPGIKTQERQRTAAAPFCEYYKTVGGKEYFLSIEDENRMAVFAFLRLRLPDQTTDTLCEMLPEIRDCAFIRELHTYGQMVRIGKREDEASQHTGLGKRLVARAEAIAKQEGYDRIAVISGVGVRGYYRKLGYRLGQTYMIKKI